MHREASHINDPFRVEPPWGLYLITAIVGSLLVLDLWPYLAEQLTLWGLTVYSWPRTIGGVRYAWLAALLGGGRILYLSLENLLRGRLGADLAIAVAVLAALALGEVLVAAEVAAIGLVGECLEAYVFGRTQRALSRLTELFPRRCWLLRDGQPVRVFVTDLQVGDRVVVKPGGRVPVDGVVVAGRAAVDSSALTGESVPVDKQLGDDIWAGSIVCDAPLTIEARRTGRDTVAGQLITLTAQALQDKPTLERQADRWARYFLPLVGGAALLVFCGNVVWQLLSTPSAPDLVRPTLRAAARSALYPTLGVLVAACPCALILATPAATLAALGRLAGSGVLLKGGAVLERLAATHIWACDKTGTLTEGRLEVVRLQPLAAGIDEQQLLTLAATAEQASDHPIAEAVIAAARQRGCSWELLTQSQTHAGGGVTATMADGTRIAVGQERFLLALGISPDPLVESNVQQADAAGETVVLVARADMVVGLIGLRDRLRPEAAAVLDQLRQLGYASIALLTGDRRAVAHAIAAALPITEVHAEMLPADKAAWVAQHSSAGVVFVGDGINDAPALARASVGIALGSGTELAAQAGDIVLLGEPLRQWPFLVRLARQTVRILRQNIYGFAFGVNLAGVLIIGGLWPWLANTPEQLLQAPLFGVLYHQIGSLLVLLNSLRLLAFERPIGHRWEQLRSRIRTWENHWQALSLDALLHAAVHRWRSLLAALAGLGGLCWSASALTQVAPEEIAVVLRWGRPVAELSPGLHLRWPWPIETVLRLRPAEVRQVTLGFRILESTAPLLPLADPAFTWSSAHGGPLLPRTDEAVMITGDGELVEVFATLRYQVADPQRFLFDPAAPEGLLRGELEAILRELFAAHPFQELLTRRRSELEAEAVARLRCVLQQMDPACFGLAIDGLTLHDLHPPPEVVPAYHAVARAIQQRDRLINQAQADALRTQRRASEYADRLVRQAQADAHALVQAAHADYQTFLAWTRARHHLSPQEQAAWAWERQQRLQQGESASAVDADLARRQQQILAQRRFLMDTRLALRAAAEALRHRDKVLIDADLPPGKRQLFLLDPNWLRLPAPPPADENRAPAPAGG
jgi:Cu+-exporting ATPase